MKVYSIKIMHDIREMSGRDGGGALKACNSIIKFEIGLEVGGLEAPAAVTGCLAAGHRGRLSHERGMPTGHGIAASHWARIGSHSMDS